MVLLVLEAVGRRVGSGWSAQCCQLQAVGSTEREDPEVTASCCVDGQAFWLLPVTALQILPNFTGENKLLCL